MSCRSNDDGDDDDDDDDDGVKNDLVEGQLVSDGCHCHSR